MLFILIFSSTFFFFHFHLLSFHHLPLKWKLPRKSNDDEVYYDSRIKELFIATLLNSHSIWFCVFLSVVVTASLFLSHFSYPLRTQGEGRKERGKKNLILLTFIAILCNTYTLNESRPLPILSPCPSPFSGNFSPFFHLHGLMKFPLLPLPN